MWQAVKFALHHHGKTCTQELLHQLQKLEKLLAPSSFIEELEVHIFSNAYDLVEYDKESYSERLKALNDKITTFGEATASQPDTLEYLAPKLWSVNTNSIWLFGKGLAKGSKDKIAAYEHLVALMQKQKLPVVHPDLFAGFINAVYTENPEQAKQLQEKTLSVPELKPYFVYLICATPIEQWGANKLLEVAKAGWLEAWRFENIRFGRTHETISDHDLTAILEAVSVLNNGVFSVIEILGMRFFIDKNNTYVPQEILRKLGRKAICNLLSLDKDDVSKHQRFGLDRILEESLTDTAPENEVSEIINLLCDGLTNYRIFRSDITKVISRLVKNFPELVLNRVLNSGDKQDYLTYYLFKDSFSRQVSYLNDVPIERVLAWCNNDETRIQMVAKSISSYKPLPKESDSNENPKATTLTEHALALLDVAQDKLAIANEIYEDICPNSWSGSRADIMEERAAAFSVLTNHVAPEIKEFTKSNIVILKQMIRETREQEALRHSEREQRFE